MNFYKKLMNLLIQEMNQPNQAGITGHDIRELSNKFRSKSDMTTYLKYNRGYFLPNDAHLTVRFLRDFFAGEKDLLKAATVMVFNVPYYEELSVEKVFAQVKDDPEIMRFMNYYSDYQVMPDRKYFYGVLGTMWPKYVEVIIKNATRIRNLKDNEEEVKEKVLIRDDIFKKLIDEPFFSKTKGRAISMLKAGAKPRYRRQKREAHEISLPFQDFKAQTEDYGENNPEQKETSSAHISSGKRAPGDVDME